MTPVKIGNWLINEKGIEWNGSKKYHCTIEVDQLNAVGSQSRSEMYDWLVHIPEKTWVTEMDTYALNTALIYALEHFGIGFDSKISFEKTLLEQKIILAGK